MDLQNALGSSVVGVAAAPNPCRFSLEEWIRTYPGWPCDPSGIPCQPTEVIVGGERGLRFPVGSLGEPSSTIYVSHGGFIFALSGDVTGCGNGCRTPTLSEEDYQRVIQGFRFAQ
jgi:hypothetical protein